MELLIMAYACKTSSAKSIVGVIPYLPYSKQCKENFTSCFIHGAGDSKNIILQVVLNLINLVKIL